MGSNPFDLDEDEGATAPGSENGQAKAATLAAEGENGGSEGANLEQIVLKPATLAGLAGGHLTNDLDALTEETRYFLGMAAMNIYESSRRLVKISELCDHGEWEKRVAMLGLTERTARRYVQMGRRLLSSSPVAALLPDRVRAFVDLDEEDIQEIEKEGTLDGRPLDKYARMSRKEIEEYARKRDRAIAQGKDQLRKAKDEIEDMQAQMAGAPRGMLDQAVLRANIALTQVATFFADEIQGLPEPEAEQVRKEKGWNIYTALMSQMDQLRPVIVDEERLTH